MAELLEDEDLELTDEERERRKAQPDSIGKPLAPPAGLIPRSAGETQSSVLPDTLTPPSTSRRPLTEAYDAANRPAPDSVGTPIQGMQPAAAPRPAYGRYQELSAQKQKPWGDLGFGGKVGRVAESIGTAINPNIVAAIPGTAAHHARDVEHARTAAQEENTTITNESEEQLREAQAEEQRALAEKNRREPIVKPQSAAALAKMGYEIGADGQLNVIPDERLSPEAKATRQMHESTSNLKEAQTELALAGNDPSSPKYKLALAKIEVERQHIQQAAQALGLHEEQFANKKQEQELVKPSGQTQSRGSAARSALEVIPSLEKLTLAQAEQMGPIVGRIAKGELAIGNVDPAVAELYGAMKSFYALQPAVHGFRNAEFVKDFETALGTLERNPQAFLAGIKGLRPTLEAVEKEGKTSHKRIVEGRDTPDASGHAKGDRRTNKRTGEVQEFDGQQWQTVKQPK